MAWISLQTLRFLGTRYYTDNKTVNENYEKEIMYRCGGGQYLKWYMIEAVNLGMARIVINGKEVGLRITPLGQRVYLQYVQRLAECPASAFEFGGVTPSRADQGGALEFSSRQDRLPSTFDAEASFGIQQEAKRDHARSEN